MKNSILFVLLGVLFATTVGCSNAPKKNEALADVSASQPSQSVETNSSDVSLGASSSGLGH